MSVALEGDVIRLQDPSRVEDAEPLLAFVQGDRTRSVDVSASGPLHTAVVQVLLAFRPKLGGPADDPFVANLLMPGLVGTLRAEAAAAEPGAGETAKRLDPGATPASVEAL